MFVLVHLYFKLLSIAVSCKPSLREKRMTMMVMKSEETSSHLYFVLKGIQFIIKINVKISEDSIRFSEHLISSIEKFSKKTLFEL